MDNVIHLRPAQAELDAAWQAYDAARLRVESLYRDDASTPDQRRTAVIEANQLHSTFKRLCERTEACRG